MWEITDLKRMLESEKNKAELKGKMEEEGGRMYFYYQGEITALLYALNLIDGYLGYKTEDNKDAGILQRD